MLNKDTSSVFTRQHTDIAKGIAILLMLYHHLFVLQERIHCEYFSVLNIFGFNVEVTLANFSKLCVCIFVFLTGYGLYYSLIKYSENIFLSYKKLIKRAFSFLFNYWVIFLTFIPIGICLGVYKFDISDILCAFLGANTSRYSSEWWYISQYLVLLFIFPSLNYLFSKAKLYKKIIVLSVYIMVYALAKISTSIFSNNVFFDYYIGKLKPSFVIITFVVGFLCAKYDIYSKTISLLNKYRLNKTIFSVCILIISIIIRVMFSNNAEGMHVDFIVVPMFIVGSTTLLYNTCISKILIYLGKHSTNMWLTHTFWCYYFWQPIVFLPYVSTFIFIWLIVLSLLTSYIINLVHIPLSNLIFGKEHRLSYKGYFYWFGKKGK